MKVNLAAKLALFDEPWSPRVIADYNGNDVMLARFDGDFRWHVHPETDDLFLVVAGSIAIDLPEETVTLEAGELFVVPAGVRHRPRALGDGAAVLLIEPKGTPNTGDPATAAPKPRL